MKKIIFLFSFLAAVATVSCTRDDVRGVAPVSEGELVTFRVGVSTLGTRATVDLSDTETMSALEAKVNRLQVFVFTQDGGLERSEYDDSGASFVELTCFAGTKEVIAVVNAPEEINWLKVSSLEDFTGYKTLLEENDFGDFFMYGSETVDISPDGDTNINIEVSRRVARVVLKSVTNNVEHNNVVGDLCLKSVYMINVAGDSEYGYLEGYVSSLWHNLSELDPDLSEGLCGLLCDEIGDVQVEQGTPYNVAHTFYCYPNVMKEKIPLAIIQTTQVSTRLVVEATLNKKLWYYPITINEILPNHSYEIDLTIEGAGADDPDSEPRSENYTFSIRIADWAVEDVPASI